MSKKKTGTQKLYRFHWDCGRQGDVYGIFAAEPAEVAAAIGREVYFGEILGKHSEIEGTLDAREIEILTDDAAFIAKAAEYGLIPSGHNPLEHLRCTECGYDSGEHAEDCESKPEDTTS